MYGYLFSQKSISTAIIDVDCVKLISAEEKKKIYNYNNNKQLNSCIAVLRVKSSLPAKRQQLYPWEATVLNHTYLPTTLKDTRCGVLYTVICGLRAQNGIDGSQVP